MPVLDTSFLVDLLKGKPELKRIIAEIGTRNLKTTIFSRYELLRGASKADIAKVNGLLDTLGTYDFTEESMRESVRIYKSLRGRGELINEIDMLIAGISITNGELLYTRDRDFENISSPYIKLV
jgi:tRNA(fMet)-specific endonuclease VapC